MPQGSGREPYSGCTHRTIFFPRRIRLLVEEPQEALAIEAHEARQHLVLPGRKKGARRFLTRLGDEDHFSVDGARFGEGHRRAGFAERVAGRDVGGEGAVGEEADDLGQVLSEVVADVAGRSLYPDQTL